MAEESIMKDDATSKWIYMMKSEADGCIERFKEELCVVQPLGFDVQDRKTHICRLKKALCGVKQAPRAWNAYIGSYLTKLGFTSSSDLNLHFKLVQGMTLIMVLYIDDLFLTGSEPSMIKRKKDCGQRYTSIDMRLYGYTDDDCVDRLHRT